MPTRTLPDVIGSHRQSHGRAGAHPNVSGTMAGWRDPILIASDVDGTLLGPSESLSARTIATVRRAIDAGVPFVLASGRPPRWIAPDRASRSS